MYEPIQYFDEMQILQSDKDRRTQTAQKFFNKMVNFLKQQLINLMSGVFLYDKSTMDYENELMDIYLSMAVDRYDSIVINKAKQFSVYIQETTERAVKEAKGNENYQNAIMNGLRVVKPDIPESVIQIFSKERAMTIALNETNWIYNYENHKIIVETQETHTWLSKHDEFVRDHHIDADSQTVPVNEPFIVGGYPMMFPLDDSLGAPLSEIMNCRCVEI